MSAESHDAQSVMLLSRIEKIALPGESVKSEAHFVSFAGWPGEEAAFAVYDIPHRVRPRLIFHQLALPPELGENFLRLVTEQSDVHHRSNSLEMISAIWGSNAPNLETAVGSYPLESGQPYLLTDAEGAPLLGVIGTNVRDQSLTMLNLNRREYPGNIIITRTSRFMINVGATAIFPLMGTDC